MTEITATCFVPITINWTKDGVPMGEQQVFAQAVLTRPVPDDGEGWGAVGNWAAGQATATVQTGTGGG